MCGMIQQYSGSGGNEQGKEICKNDCIKKEQVTQHSLSWLIQMPSLASFSTSEEHLGTQLLVYIVFYLCLLYDMKKSRHRSQVSHHPKVHKCQRGCGEKETLLCCWQECKLVRPLWKTVWKLLRKLKIELPYDPVIPLLARSLARSLSLSLSLSKSLGCVRLFATSWTIAHLAPLSMAFSWQDYWSRLSFPSPEDLPNPRIKLRSPELQADSLPSESPGKPYSQAYIWTNL